MIHKTINIWKLEELQDLKDSCNQLDRTYTQFYFIIKKSSISLFWTQFTFGHEVELKA